MIFEPLHLALTFMAGIGLGLVYFGALWLTVRRVPGSRHPVGLVFGSLLGRLAVVLPAFYVVMGDRWERLAACLLGFVLVRCVMTRNLGRCDLPSFRQSGRTTA